MHKMIGPIACLLYSSTITYSLSGNQSIAWNSVEDCIDAFFRITNTSKISFRFTSIATSSGVFYLNHSELNLHFSASEL